MQPELDLVGLPIPESGRSIRLPLQRVDERQRIASGLRGTGRGMRPYLSRTGALASVCDAYER